MYVDVIADTVVTDVNPVDTSATNLMTSYTALAAATWVARYDNLPPGQVRLATVMSGAGVLITYTATLVYQ